MPLENRESTLSSISDALSTIASKIEGTFANIKADCQWRGGKVVKLTIDRSDIKIKVEPNLIFRGSVFPTLDQDISKEAEKLFGMFITALTLSIADLYGSKICAALDRQHPRDFFDVHILLRNEGLTDDIRKAFVVYLAGHNRPMNELLNLRKMSKKKNSEMVERLKSVLKI